MARPNSIRGNVARTSRNADAALADAQNTLAELREAIDIGKELLAIGKESAATLSRILAAIEKNGITADASILGHKLPAEATVKLSEGDAS